MPRSVVAKDPWGRAINHRTPTAPKGQNEISQGRTWRRPGYGRATGALDRPHRAIRSAQILAVFEDAKRYISRIDLRTGIETRMHLESTRTGDLRLEKADQAGGRSRMDRSDQRESGGPSWKYRLGTE